ncbi:GumC family protein [Paracoccus aerodenitrificans]|uniref:GumC family protein n=1 Tax=Paracoccus aerodenitrificans TaxID=3017781 RepID=UPI0022F0A7AA|nr:AAA family ATPase [Paracoccus aerodenitrificans]WBU63461.1 AAA family ATPase [Paracoccus aerodenitrificans]
MNNTTRISARKAVSPARAQRMDSEEFIQLMRRNIWMLLSVAALVMGGTYFYLSRQPPLYSSESAMALTNSEVRISQVDTQLEVYDLTRARVETELDRLRSRNFAEHIAKALNLFDNTIFLPIEEGDPRLGSNERARDVVDKVLGAYELERSGESLVISIRSKANSPELAASIANGVVDSFIETSVNQQVETLERSTEYLRQQVEQTGEDLTIQQMELADFIRENLLDDEELPERLRRERTHIASVLEVMDTRNEGDTAERRRLEADLAKVEEQLGARTRNEMQLSRMERTVDLLGTRYQTMVERLSQLEPQRDQIQPDARQITRAEVPFEPSWPNIPTTMALALPASLVLGFILAMLRSTMNRQIWTGAQAAHVSQLPNLGNLPRIRRRGLFSRDHQPIWFLRRFPRSEYSEAIRSLLTIWSSQDSRDRSPRIAMITSALPNEGKSTVSTSMAAIASLEGQRVLLLDFDTQRGGASRIIANDPRAIRVERLISGDLKVNDAVVPVEGYDGLHLIRFEQNMMLTPQLAAEFARKLMPRLISAYDLIVMDTPPTLGVADAARLGVMADETLVVVRAGKTPERALLNCVERLEDSGIKLAGTVINDIEPHRYRQLNLGGGYGYY